MTENHKKNKNQEVFYITALTLTTLVAIYLYKKWKEEQRKAIVLEEILKVKDEENDKLS